MVEKSRVSQNTFQDGKFYIFDTVDENFPKEIILPFIEEVKKVESLQTKKIEIFISSYGGYVNYCFDLISQIERAKAKGIEVITYVTSMACSAGSLIAITGSKRYVSEYAVHLVHSGSNWAYSHNMQMSENNFEYDKFWRNKCEGLYKKYTKMKDIKKKMLTDNHYILGSEELIKQGFADNLLT